MDLDLGNQHLLQAYLTCDCSPTWWPLILSSMLKLCQLRAVALCWHCWVLQIQSCGYKCAAEVAEPHSAIAKGLVWIPRPTPPAQSLSRALLPSLGDFFLVFPFWLFIASSYTLSCQHLSPGFSLCLNSGECGNMMGRNSSALAPAEEYVQWTSLLERMGRPSNERWLETHKTVSHRCLVRCWSLWCVGFPLLSYVPFCLYFFFPFILFLSTFFSI